ncbi:glutaredoxin domain-containing protein [Clostridium ganghwense]|uniref:Glutathione S-transferase N-terminal domain-containing protein n=1 Tax=Clostridium ganghwense TaxID=312089 RepID=A0ABT4CKQ7_9CLOT|nr:glutaredoxin domain-containing protein [Clostridium ganghwense]MCY6369625.1 glutathione S-transferase N-terminal domain-containing protein [Clostridium ganghwense]
MIKVYSTPTCPWCKKVKAYLESINARYKDINVVEDREAREKMIEISGQQGVPVIDIDGEIVLGFDKPRIINALDKRKIGV